MPELGVVWGYKAGRIAKQIPPIKLGGESFKELRQVGAERVSERGGVENKEMTIEKDLFGKERIAKGIAVCVAAGGVILEEKKKKTTP